MTTGRINQIALGFQFSQPTCPPTSTACTHACMHATTWAVTGIGKVVTFKLCCTCGPASSLSPCLCDRGVRSKSTRTTLLIRHWSQKQESVRHSIVAHSLFPFPNTSLKERMTYSQGGLWLRFAVTERMCLRFSEKKLLDDARQSLQLHFPSVDVVSEMCGFRA